MGLLIGLTITRSCAIITVHVKMRLTVSEDEIYSKDVPELSIDPGSSEKDEDVINE